MCSWVLCCHLAHSWLASILLGVAFSMYQAAQLKLPRQACKGLFLIARVPPVEHMLTGKLKINGESAATRNTLLLGDRSKKAIHLCYLLYKANLGGSQKPWMHGEFPVAEVYMGWVKIDEFIQWIKAQL